jgi:hypothetical protein
MSGLLEKIIDISWGFSFWGDIRGKRDWVAKLLLP